MKLRNNNDIKNIIDKPFAIKCPYCNTQTGISVVSVPRYELTIRYKPERIGIVYKCDICNRPIPIFFGPLDYETEKNVIIIPDEFELPLKSVEKFEYEYLPENVTSNFREAAKVFSADCYNAFAAMCRRTLQVVASELGVKGNDKVKKQLDSLRDIIEMDEDTKNALEIIMVSGHDGSHPHLPEVDECRATIIMTIMKDILTQLFVRKAKIEEAKQLRNKKIEEKKNENETD